MHWPWFLKEGFVKRFQPPFLHCAFVVGEAVNVYVVSLMTTPSTRIVCSPVGERPTGVDHELDASHVLRADQRERAGVSSPGEGRAAWPYLDGQRRERSLIAASRG
jgi:hypothetical protein